MCICMQVDHIHTLSCCLCQSLLDHGNMNIPSMHHSDKINSLTIVVTLKEEDDSSNTRYTTGSIVPSQMTNLSPLLLLRQPAYCCEGITFSQHAASIFVAPDITVGGILRT